MSAPIKFVLHGKAGGVEITPRSIGLSQFNEFNQQVEAFIAGRERAKLDDVHVAIEESSYVLRVVLPVALGTGVDADLLLLKRQDSLGEVDPRRAEIVQKWQAKAKANPDVDYEIRPIGEGLQAVRIGHDTDFRVGEIIPWVAVQKYLFGKIVDMGGAQKANVHLKLARGGKTLVIGASQAYLEQQDKNRLYHKALLHVRGEQHFKTGDLRNLQLIAFVPYESKFDEDALDRFAAAGKKAWADVPDAAVWVREMRGG